MADKERHQAFMRFVSKVTNLMSEYTAEDLGSFLHSSKQGFPSLAPVIEACIGMLTPSRGRADQRLASRSEAIAGLISKRRRETAAEREAGPLFNLLLSKELFPTNAQLGEFAVRVLPGMPRRRYDKMSRADIAGRVIEYLETLDLARRRRLEAAMRKAIASISGDAKAQPESFFSQWEKIIKGIEL